MTPPNPVPSTEFLELYRAGLNSAVELMKASLENAERLSQQQLSSVREALEEHVRSVEALGKARSLEDLVALQQKMAGAQLERVMGYWSSVCQAAGQNQTEALGRVQQQISRSRDLFADTYALTARATEEAATIAAAKASPRPVAKEKEAPPPPAPAPKRGSQGQSMHR
ncbi:MAG TPA: phasin family protein [Burkholderiales bacterium]|nr:phasin family protein [Burkholderiales bacterium]